MAELGRRAALTPFILRTTKRHAAGRCRFRPDPTHIILPVLMTFFCKLVAPRADFVQTLTPGEMELMQRHGGYWNQGIADGHVVAYGLVADPRGAFGIGIVNFDSGDDVLAFTDGDPVIQSGHGFSFEIAPMPMGVRTAATV